MRCRAPFLKLVGFFANMNKNLRSKKVSEGATETREDGNENIQEFRILAANLSAKMDELAAASKSHM